MQVKTIVIANSSEEYPRQSEASIAELRDGRLMIAWQEWMRHEDPGSDSGPNRIVAMTSRDEGETWEHFRILVEMEPGDHNVYSPNFVRLPGGELLLMYLRNKRFAANEPLVSDCQLMRSSDDGATFSPPSAVWTGKPYYISNSTVKLLSGGRLLLPLEKQLGIMWSSTDVSAASCVYSDDSGRTWRESETWCELPMRGASEPHVAELSDGRIMMVLRNQLGSVFKSYSSDRGATWSKPQTTGLKSPESCPDLMRIPGTDDVMITWNDSWYDPGCYSHYGKRTPLTVAVSRDGGETWGRHRHIADDPSMAYSNPACTFAANGKAYITYWTCPYEASGRMMVRRIDLKAAVFDIGSLYG